MEDGSALYDSRVIVDYLDTVTPLARLIPEASRQRIETKRWKRCPPVFAMAGNFGQTGNRAQGRRKKRGFDRTPDGQGQERPGNPCHASWKTSPGAPAIPTASPTLPRAPAWDG